MKKNFVIFGFPLLGLVIWFLAATFFLYEFFLRTFIGTVADQLIPQLHLNAESFSLVGSAYFVTYGLMQIPVGILLDKFSVKLIMTFATFICALATFLFARATGFNSAVLGRLLMGFGSSFAFVCLLVVAVTWFPRKYFGFFAGISQFIGTMGPLLAGGPLIHWMNHYHLNWRQALTIIAVFGLLLMFLSLLFVREKPREQKAALVYLEIKKPLKEGLYKLIKNKQAWYVALYSACVYVSIAIMGAMWGTDYLQARGLSQDDAANMVSLAWLGYAIGCPLFGMISDLMKRRLPMLIVSAVLGFISISLIVYVNLSQQLSLYAILFFIFGLAASGQNIGFAAISEHVGVAVRATALGLNNAVIMFFSAILPPIASYFIFIRAGANSTHFQVNDFFLAFMCMPLVYLLAILLSVFFIKETYCRPLKSAVFLNPK